MAFRRSAGQNCSMKAVSVIPSLLIKRSSRTISSLMTYSRTKFALMITAAGGLPAWIAAWVFRLVSS